VTYITVFLWSAKATTRHKSGRQTISKNWSFTGLFDAVFADRSPAYSGKYGSHPTIGRWYKTYN